MRADALLRETTAIADVATVGAAPRASATDLHWLPEPADWRGLIKALGADADPLVRWQRLVAAANVRLDMVRTIRIDHELRRQFGDAPPPSLATKPVRLAVLGSSTLTHLLPAIRVAGLRRGLWVKTYEADFGQYLQELSDTGSPLHAFAPNAILLAFDAFHLARGADPSLNEAAASALLDNLTAHFEQCWGLAKAACKGPVLQQTMMPLFPPVLGNNEQRLPGSRQWLTARINMMLRERATSHGVDLLSIDSLVAVQGKAAWHDPMLWHRAKQEISPAATPLYGDQVGRLLAAAQGRSFKCLVLDLDNTLWGGVIGDDGMEGIVLGQGSTEGEAFVALQGYALDLAKRGVILAVCSKNDEANALAPFERHPDMVLRRTDIAAFVANWSDKAQNLRAIAQQLNIGLDALVFLDDNPFERNLVRGELPMVAVPELPEDPAAYLYALADAGYFEGLSVTEEDRDRSLQYQANAARESMQSQAADLPTYLRGLEMKLLWRRFDTLGLPRIVQLINKTNQFNLTTRRYAEADVLAVINDPDAFGLQLRLLDRFGDNGIIAIIIGRLAQGIATIDTWLMSCRVLGRQVEETTLNLIAAEAQRLGAVALVGEYRPTAKNGMVKAHYEKLGFTRLESDTDGSDVWRLDLAAFTPAESFIEVVES